ncbi:thioredoxin-disulfide reductase [Boudabousia tangfeifanii]|uniref:Thioredoxin reductase n=1 Tax=Boudabousia tangfeifanii TaxID=1912795 RepID=A0A1D9MN56_9ACTO|nr:thioredoxin-disulfide reductase [Boudabousia tangfeifanii]
MIVVGSGPAGYTAATYLARAQLKPLVLAGALAAGGALMNTTEVENFPGFPEGIMGPDLMNNMQAQAEKFGAQIEFEDVVEVDLSGTEKVVKTEDATYYAKAVILATGSAYRKLGLPNEDEFSGRGVSYCATCDGFFFKGQEIIVVGGGDSAMEEATFLTSFASKVTVVHRRDELRASKVMADRAMNNPKIEFAWNSQVTALHGEVGLTKVTLTDTQTGETRELEATGLFVAIGHDPRNELFKEQVELDAAGYVKVAEPSTKTNLSGVFACGDLVDHTYRQAITAAGSGCRAALDAQKFLEDSEN